MLGACGASKEDGGTGGSPGVGGNASSKGGAAPAGGQGGGATSGGTLASGGSNAGGMNAAGASQGGGTTQLQGGQTTTAMGGAASAGEGAGGEPSTDAGAGGAPTTGTGPVKGTVIDFYGHKLSGVRVTIGDTTVVTDAQGRFEIQDDVPEEYEIACSLRPALNFVWIYQGVTRRNPTLQVRQGTPYRSGQYKLELKNGSFAADEITHVGFGSADGGSQREVSSATSTGGWVWYGPETTAANVHALRWKADSDDLPVSYSSHASLFAGFSTTSGDLPEISLDMAPTTITTRPVSVKINVGTTTEQRRTYAYVTFKDSTRIELVSDYSEKTSVVYNIPTLPDSVVTIAAHSGFFTAGPPYSVAWKDVPADATNLELNIPSAPSPLTPQPNAMNVDSNTQFTWGDDVTTPQVWLFHAYELSQPPSASDKATGDVYIVTNKKSLRIPTVGGTFPLSSATRYAWVVERSTTATTVDQATTSAGFLNTYAFVDREVPEGPPRGDGVLAESEWYAFVTK